MVRKILHLVLAALVLLVVGLGLAALSGTAISAAAVVAGTTATAPAVADPSIVQVDGTWHLFGTNDGTANVPHWTSTDGTSWTYVGDALGALPAGVIADYGMVWAPDVVQRDDGAVLYVTLFDQQSARPCIWTATAAALDEVFVVDGAWPLVCDESEGGAIDPDAHQAADGTWWLTWKVDGNCCDLPTLLRSQQLGPDGETLIGAPSDLLTASEDWQDGVVEGPSVVTLPDDTTLLLYAAGDWESAGYATGAATCDGADGPCEALATPILATDDEQIGPGGADATMVDGELWIAHHVWSIGSDGTITRTTSLELVRAASS